MERYNTEIKRHIPSLIFESPPEILYGILVILTKLLGWAKETLYECRIASNHYNLVSKTVTVPYETYIAHFQG